LGGNLPAADKFPYPACQAEISLNIQDFCLFDPTSGALPTRITSNPLFSKSTFGSGCQSFLISPVENFYFDG
jgi:hypothetical protein